MKHGWELPLKGAGAGKIRKISSNVKVIFQSMAESQISDWLVLSTPLKNMNVSWDHYSQLNGKIKLMFQTTNQQMIQVPQVP